MKRFMSLSILALVILASAIGSASAGASLLGTSLPMVTVVQTGNAVQFLTLSDLYANKGLVNAAENERFVFEAQVDFFDTQTGSLLHGTATQKFGVQPDADAELRKGSTVAVVPLTVTVQTEVADVIQAALNSGTAVTYEARVSLVLLDGAGARHHLDSVAVVGTIDPAPAEPSVTPTAGTPGTQFTISDPQGRIEPGSVALFYKVGQDPAQGEAAPIEFLDAHTLIGTVPQLALEGEGFISVRPDRLSAPFFDDLRFVVG